MDCWANASGRFPAIQSSNNPIIRFHVLVVADGRRLNKKPTAVLQPWVLVKLCHSTSANGVANYNDDQCDNLYDVFQHYGFNLMEFPAGSSPVFGQIHTVFCARLPQAKEARRRIGDGRGGLHERTVAATLATTCCNTATSRPFESGSIRFSWLDLAGSLWPLVGIKLKNQLAISRKNCCEPVMALV